MRQAFSLLWQAVLDLLYPPHCLLCQTPLSGVAQHICSTCMIDLKPMQGVRCIHCGGPAADPCVPCRGRTWDYDQLFILYDFNDKVRQLVHQLKYQGKTLSGRILGHQLGRYIQDRQGWEPETLIVPVPLHGSRRRERGYNQSAVLARALAEVVDGVVDERILERVRATETQTALDAGGRRANVEGAFRVCRPVEHRRILLVDDVMTTGATVNACARALKAEGCEQVLVAAVASPVQDREKEKAT